MKSMARFAPSWIFLGIIVGVAWFTVSPIPAEAQCTGVQGQNAVYAYCGTGGALGIVGSSAFIDASKFVSSGDTFCSTIYKIIQPTAYSAAVIDARGLNSGNVNMTCAAGWTPWNNGSTYVNKPSTILLPAGTIGIAGTWILPSNTRLIGEGDGIPPSSGAFPGTRIQLVSGNTVSSMIQFGSSSSCSGGISVERLTLDGQAQAIDGIVNQYCPGPSSVDHVTLFQILGTGLSVSANANDSGPYANIRFDTGGYSGTSSTACAQIKNVMNGSASGRTRGIHGLYCKSETADAPAAVLLDSSNNSIEDVTIVGFYDGILVGSQGNAQSNVLLNINGDTGSGGTTPVVTVHIPTTTYTVSDLSMMGIHTVGGSGVYSIHDELTGMFFSDTSIGMYALGRPLKNGTILVGYSRFTTSPNAATWAAGSGAATGTCNSRTAGSLYSNNSSSSTVKALFVCPVGGGTWVGIK
jgi:hypothetical protein